MLTHLPGPVPWFFIKTTLLVMRMNQKSVLWSPLLCERQTSPYLLLSQTRFKAAVCAWIIAGLVECLPSVDEPWGSVSWCKPGNLALGRQREKDHHQGHHLLQSDVEVSLVCMRVCLKVNQSSHLQQTPQNKTLSDAIHLCKA